MAESDVGPVLVTGASGFIAKHCIVQLLETGLEVRATLRSPGAASSVVDAVARGLGGKREVAERVSFVEADLNRDDGWVEAAEGCSYVLHLASPFPLVDPRNRDELIAPARDGALRVLKAARNAGVRRVVLTSSMAAVCYGAGDPPDRAMTEDDWTDPDRPGLTAYLASKTIAERAAWDWLAAEGGGLELAVINPGLVLGPALDRDLSSSLDVIRIYAAGEYPAIPRVSYPISDVRDVARMHIVAMSHPQAAGKRWNCAEGTLAVSELLKIVGEALPDTKRKLPTIQAPDFVIRGLALFDRSARSLLPDLGRRNRLDNARARAELGMTFHSPREAVEAAAHSLRDLNVI
ncbi:MAG TPA: aldehyde reductase [Hyphomicrobiaceae bacterium]|nr:aldehyde reductase [Hyphomicrobiaceae bacterium]